MLPFVIYTKSIAYYATKAEHEAPMSGVQKSKAETSPLVAGYLEVREMWRILK